MSLLNRFPFRAIMLSRRLLMKYWFYFWIFCFTVAGSAFALIALIVVARGTADLQEMFTRLESHAHSEGPETR